MLLPPLYHYCASFGRPIASIGRSLCRPLCLHSATTATIEPPWQWFCLHSASFARPVAPLQQLWSFKEGTSVVLQQLHRNRTFWVWATTERLDHFSGRSKVARRSQPCVKGVLCINLSDASAPLYHHCASFGRPKASIGRSLCRPLCLHSATTATLEPPWQWFCLHSACFARPVVPLLQCWWFKEGTRDVLQQLHRNINFWVWANTERPDHFSGRPKVTRRSQPCVKGFLTHWGRVTHICVGKLTIIGSDDGLSPKRRQAIIWTNAGILLIGPLGTNFSEILIEIQTFSLKKIPLKMSSAKCCSFRLGFNVLS